LVQRAHLVEDLIAPVLALLQWYRVHAESVSI
jgi:hypothetical protein